MDIYKKITRQAHNLVNKLQEDISTGKKQIIENYGQNEINKFIDNKINPVENQLTYSDICNIKDVLYKVSSIC